MSAPFFAHGQVLLPVFFLGLPAALLALICLIAAVVFSRKKDPEAVRRSNVFLVGAMALGLLALASPAFEPLFR